MENKDKENYLKMCNDRIYEQLTYAETKNAILSALLGATIFGIIGIIMDLNVEVFLWLIIVLGVSMLSMVVALIISLSSFVPVVSTLNSKRNLYFYGDIANYKDGIEYLEAVDNSKSLEEQLADQNIKVSQIICRKHKKFSLALNFTIASILPIYYIYMIIKAVRN